MKAAIEAIPAVIPEVLGASWGRCIGVSLDARWVRAAQVSNTGGRASLAGALALRRRAVAGDGVAPLTKDEARGLLDALSRHGMQGRRIVIAAPFQAAPLAGLELPPKSSGAPLEQIAAGELARMHRVQPGSFEVALWEVARPAERGARPTATSYMAAMGMHGQTEALAAAFDGVPLDVVSIIPEACALARGLAVSDGARGIVSWTRSGLELIVSDGAGNVVFERGLAELGLARLYGAGKERLRLEEEAMEGALWALASPPTGAQIGTEMASAMSGVERLVADLADLAAEEISRSLSYASRRNPECEQRPLWMVGEGATVAGLASRLAVQLGQGVEVKGAADVVEVPSRLARVGTRHDFAGAIGASLIGADAGRKP